MNLQVVREIRGKVGKRYFNTTSWCCANDPRAVQVVGVVRRVAGTPKTT